MKVRGERPVVLGAIERGPSSANLNNRDRNPGWNPAYEGVILVPRIAGGTSAHDSAPTSVGELTADASAYVSLCCRRRKSRSV